MSNYNYYKADNKEFFSKAEIAFRKSNQSAAAKLLGVDAKKIGVVGNCLFNDVVYEDSIFIGSEVYAKYDYFYIYQKAKGHNTDVLSGYLVPVMTLSEIYNSAVDNKRVVMAPRQHGRGDTLTRLRYNEFAGKGLEFMIK